MREENKATSFRHCSFPNGLLFFSFPQASINGCYTFSFPSDSYSAKHLQLVFLLFNIPQFVIFSSFHFFSLHLFKTQTKSEAKPKIFTREEKERCKGCCFEEGISDELIISDQKLMLGSNCSVFEDSNLFRSSQSSENSISDDESLIEILLPDGHYLGSGKTSSEFKLELLDYLSKSLFLQHGLMELLLEIDEEDNMIEIDIATSSIKCPRFKSKA